MEDIDEFPRKLMIAGVIIIFVSMISIVTTSVVFGKINIHPISILVFILGVIILGLSFFVRRRY